MKRLLALVLISLCAMVGAAPAPLNPDSLDPEPAILERASADRAVAVPTAAPDRKSLTNCGRWVFPRMA